MHVCARAFLGVCRGMYKGVCMCVCLLCFILVCLDLFCFCFFVFLLACLFSKKRERRQGVRWLGREHLGDEEGERVQNILHEKSYFQFKKKTEKNLL